MNDPYQTPQTETNSETSDVQPKGRHGCLTAYLVFMIIANSLASVSYLIGREGIKKALPNMPDWAFPVLIALGIFNLVCAVALFRWKKWGFLGFTASSVVALVVNLMIGISPIQAAFGLLGLAILYGALQIGKENKGWPQLK